jgi:hypothetical protein
MLLDNKLKIYQSKLNVINNLFIAEYKKYPAIAPITPINKYKLYKFKIILKNIRSLIHIYYFIC